MLGGGGELQHVLLYTAQETIISHYTSKEQNLLFEQHNKIPMSKVKCNIWHYLLLRKDCSRPALLSPAMWIRIRCIADSDPRSASASMLIRIQAEKSAEEKKNLLHITKLTWKLLVFCWLIFGGFCLLDPDPHFPFGYTSLI